MTARAVIHAGVQSLRGLLGPAAGAVAAGSVASVGGLLEGQAFYRLVLDSGGLAVLAFALFFVVRRFTQGTRESMAAVVAIAERGEKTLKDELQASRDLHEAHTAELHKRFDRQIERHQIEMSQIREQIATPVIELVREIRAERRERRRCQTPSTETTP